MLAGQRGLIMRTEPFPLPCRRLKTMLADCRTPAPKGLSVSSSMGTPSRSVHDDEEEEEPEEADHVDGNLEEPTSQGKHRSRATSDASKRSKGVLRRIAAPLKKTLFSIGS